MMRFATKTTSSLFLAVFCCGAIAVGCSGSSDPASEKSESTGLEGTYAASGDGPIDAIRFDSSGYGLIPSGCTEASCTEAGTYSIDSSGTSLSLTDAKTNETRTLSLQITETQPASSTSGTSSLRLDSLVTGATGGTSGTGTTGGTSLVGSNQSLVNVASGALVNGQQVALLINGVNVNPACLTGIPTGYGDPNGTKAAAYWAMCPQGVRTPLA